MNVYAKAFTEVYTILSYLNKEEYNKIPKEVLDAIKKNRDTDYIYEVNKELDLEKQEMLLETRAILFNLFRDYLATPKQKEKIVRFQRQEKMKIEEEKRKKYNGTNMFKKHKREI